MAASQSFISDDYDLSNNEAGVSNRNNKTAAAGGLVQTHIDSYAVFRFLHSPEHIFADSFLLFEKLMELGIKDMFYKGKSLKGYTTTSLFLSETNAEDSDSISIMPRKVDEREMGRIKRKRDLAVR